MNTSINKKGQFNLSTFSETFVCPFDTEFYVEPDKSVWVRIVHNDNAGSNKFNSTDTFASSVYTDKTKWFYVSLCNNITNNTYELMIKQKADTSSAETKYRWIQTVNPMTASYADVALANVTRITTEGYSTYGNYAGIYKENSHSYLVTNNGTSGQWWGAIGCWTAYSGDTIPGYAQVAISTGYIDLYLRIDNQTSSKPSMYKNSLVGKYFYEI